MYPLLLFFYIYVWSKKGYNKKSNLKTETDLRNSKNEIVRMGKMSAVQKMNSLNQVPKGTKIFEKDENIACIGMIIKGSVRIQNLGVHKIAEKGALIGVEDLIAGRHLADYIAQEDTVIYAFKVANAGLLDAFLNSNPDYRGIAIHSVASNLRAYLKERELLLKFITGVSGFFKGVSVPEGGFPLKSDGGMISYYQEFANIPLEIHKKYYAGSNVITMRQLSGLSMIAQDVLRSSEEAGKFLEEVFWKQAGMSLYDDAALIDIKYFEEKLKQAVRQKEERKKNGNAAGALQDPKTALKNSLFQILKFSNIKDEDQKEITSLIQLFVNAKDRLSTQDDMRKLKKQITDYFFRLYKLCVFQWFEDENVPLPVKLFLNYGYMDERLLDEDQALFLCETLNEEEEDFACPIYTMAEWLKEIHEGRKDPSRNSFEQDYRDVLREEKRTSNITEQQEREYLEDSRRKVMFEIDNMFVSNNKIVNGKLSTYVPVIYKEGIYGHLDRLYLSKKKLCDTILDLEKKDYTVFNREVLYTNPALKIEREYVIKHVYPDVIIAPVYGTASSMWQEITGKKRDTPGRFLFPAISENEVEKLVTKAFGRFHWEYCRCEQGVYWNNIQHKSLTSEYMDYIQYYRKNGELSEEKREKIKTQILKARNNSREIFLSDYEMWIYNESKSAIKLNKVSRAILATYCPFSKEIRENLKSNAAIAEAMSRHQRELAEKIRGWDMRIKRRENNGLVVPDEFYETYRYYAGH